MRIDDPSKIVIDCNDKFQGSMTSGFVRSIDIIRQSRKFVIRVNLSF